MEHENTYTLMMDALDGVLEDENKLLLEAHLQTCSDCLREWHALLAIETLLHQAPVLSPAAGFAQRTLARVPNRQVRIWSLSVLYLVLLFSGVLPILIGVWAYNRYSTFFSQPDLFQSIWQPVNNAFQVVGAVFSALFSSIGEYLLQQPAIIGWAMIMLGVVAVWSGLFRQLLSRPQVIRLEVN